MILMIHIVGDIELDVGRLALTTHRFGSENSDEFFAKGRKSN
jgi:hypothetical protein